MRTKIIHTTAVTGNKISSYFLLFNILGGSGMVFVAQAQDTGKEYALKVIQ